MSGPSATLPTALPAIAELARQIFASEQEAVTWLESPHAMLGGRLPCDAIATPEGAAKVREILVAMGYGGVA